MQSNNEQSEYCINTVLECSHSMPSNLINHPYTLEQFAAENFHQSYSSVNENKIATNEINNNLTDFYTNFTNQNINIETTKTSNDIRTQNNSSLMPFTNIKKIISNFPILPLPYLFDHNG